ncbi:hypothetical protein J8Z24_09650 [Pseudoalteromonas sp. SCSIO 43201]|uniref:hypothetical protein n=1 Tax=Pseudoalteromonas TaxID=53246 RepID=UPI0020756E7F|nr:MULTISPECIES: hypothetical protein [Pseudoalteromonas]MDW7548166.1 hypothetical protein [Pseudoalteromonas peptidolytica]USD27250.1 hypothetical protein J8Z24_09650 [Pseudoalteromonas sp. SCSIO 43201]
MSKLQSELNNFSSTSGNKKINLIKKELLDLVSSSAGGGAYYKNFTKYVKPDEVPTTLRP